MIAPAPPSKPTPAPPPLPPVTGADLRALRLLAGLTLDSVAAATRVRRHHLELIEADRWEELPGPVYARGHARTYAALFGTEADLLPPFRQRAPVVGVAGLSLVRQAPRAPARFVLTRPALSAMGVLVGLLVFLAYAWYEIDSARREFSPAPVAANSAPPLIASPPPLPSPPVSPAGPATSTGGTAGAGKRVTVALRSTQSVWIDVVVDNQRPDGAQGRFLEPGSVASYSGRQVSVTSGNGGNTLVTLNGRDFGTLGEGVLTRDFSGQT